MRKLPTRFAGGGWSTLWSSMLCLLLLGYSHVSLAQWNNAYFRGTPNDWVASAMTKNTSTGLWETRQNFAGTNPRFKITRYTDNWTDSYPAQDFLIASAGDYHIAFNETSKAISAVKLAATVSGTSICFNNPGNFANPAIYFWAPTPASSMTNLPAWPGRAMVKIGNYYCYDLASHLTASALPTSLSIIFSNNGANQTANLTFNGSGSGAGCYENAVWKSLPQCGFYLSGATASSSVASSAAVSSVVPSSVAASSVASSSVAAQSVSANSICFNNPANYANPSLYFWNPAPAGAITALPAWPGKSMTKRGVFYCYDFGAELAGGVMPTSLDVIFNNTGAPQSANLKFTGAGCYENTVWKTLAQCGFTTAVASSSAPASSSVAPASSSIAPSSSSVAPSSSSLSIASSSVAQTSSSAPSSVAATNTTLYFKNTANWASVNVHFFNAVPARTGSVWPGPAMVRLANVPTIYSYQFTGALTSAGMVFSANGNPKTGDLNLVAPNTCYDFGTASWKTPAACGVPATLVANAGVDRKANVNSRQALSAAASTGDYTTASWTSTAWAGALVGKQVVTPPLTSLGNHTVTLTLTAADGSTATDTLVINVVAATQGLPERPQLAAPLGFPITGTVSSGKYRFVNAFPALESYFFSPVMVTNDGANDLVYVVDKEGAIYVFPNKESVVPAEVRKLLDIKATVLNNNESGMLSMAFDPHYASNGFIYVYYIFGESDNFYPRTDGIVGGKTGDAIIERWTVDNPANPTSAGSKVELLRILQPGEDHKGGMMQFHPTEGYLYVGIGEGGYGHSAFPLNPQPSDAYQRRHNNSAQDPTTLRGKFIRIQPLATPVNGKYYSVPADNPFVGQAGYLPEIWSMGHRNPWRWAFDTDAPYTLWETEIGQDTDLAYEEVNIITKGQNYGWPVCEGTRNRGALGSNGGVAASKNCLTDYVPPREGYGRTSGVSIIGGFVYRGTQLPALNGSFIFGDYVTKRLWSVSNDGQAKKLISEAFPYYISSIGKDLQKNLLISSHGRELGGPSSIFKVVDDDVATAQIPTKLSTTGLFADLANLIPAHGVIEYSLNTSGWFDGGKMRHFIALPKSSKAGFDPTALWDLPVGAVVVKHLAVASASNANKPFTTSVLFRQETGWQAANYLWNSAGSDADLVTESSVVPDGGLASVTRKVETGSTCGGCHKTAEGQLTPLALHSRQLNGNFNYQGVIANQLTVLNSIGLFSSAIGNASSYERFAAPTDSSASLTERAKAYLDTNCAHCHAGTSGGMDLRFDTALEAMKLVNQSNRVIPGIPANSNLYKYQTGSGMRMPFGSTETNAQAETLFRNWINALGVDVVQTGVALSASKTSAEVNEVIGLSLAMLYSNSTQLPAVGDVSWNSSNPAVISTSGKTGAAINLTALSTGTVTITASNGGYSNSITLEVVPPSNPITALTIVGRANVRLLAGEKHQLALVATAANGLQGMTSRVIWTSSNPQVATVSASGLATAGTAAGTTTIAARYGDLSTSYTVTGLGQGQYVYVKKPAAWGSVSAYVWTNQNGVETARTGPWPGAALTEPATAYGAGWLRLVIPASWANSSGSTNIIFSNNGANQTANLTLTQAQPRWYDMGWLAAEPAAAAVEAGTQIQVGNGTASIGASGNLSGKLFVPGTLLDINANPAGPGMQFVHWEGSGAAYLLDANSANTQMVVGNALSLTLLAVFDAVTDQHQAARGHYQSQGCVGCHGSDGLTGDYKLTNQALAGRYSLQSLADYIATNMPKGSAGSCTGSCATSIASMILADALLPPAGVCDADSLDDLIPQDRSFRLLSTLEYNNSVRDLLGLTTNIDVTTGRIPADLPVNGFKTNANTVFTNDYAKGYVLAAETAAGMVTNLYSLAPGCNNVTCFVQNFGKRAFRRPLSSAEVTKLVTLHAAQGDLALLTAILSSPSMLYRSEVGVPKGNYYELTDYEVAAMLSYTYWATTPNAALMAAADAGQLSTPEQIATRVRSMLQDPKAQIAFERFITGWLDLDKDIKTTAISASLKADMKAETIEFVKRTVFGGGNYKDLLTANYSYMTQQMANHYGLTWPGGSGVQRVDYTGVNAERRGVLGHAGILAIQSASEKTHPVKRGLFVRRNLLCQDFPPPPVGAELKPQEDPSLTVRERFEAAHLKEGCESCHQYIDGIGFGLENYNALGLYVTTETTDNGLVKAINSLGEIGSLNSAETYLSESEPVTLYHGMDELTDLLAQSPNAQACYARQWYRYTRGQLEEASDSCTLQVFGREFKTAANANLLDLMVEFTQTKNYILRK